MLSSSEINQYYFENERFLWQNLYMSLLYDMQGVSILVFDCLCGTRLCTDIITNLFCSSSNQFKVKVKTLLRIVDILLKSPRFFFTNGEN